MRPVSFLEQGFASINIYTQVGLITLIGVISKHGILIVEFANKLQLEGFSKYKAIEIFNLFLVRVSATDQQEIQLQ